MKLPFDYLVNSPKHTHEYITLLRNQNMTSRDQSFSKICGCYQDKTMTPEITEIKDSVAKAS